ncbi:hypothetical protein X975_11109, partial [Stegodyphus mimosarum]
MAVTDEMQHEVPVVLQEDCNDKPKEPQPQWVIKRNNLIRKSDSKLASSFKPRKRITHHKNAFHLDLRNKWSQLVTNKISALAFQRSLQGHRCCS